MVHGRSNDGLGINTLVRCTDISCSIGGQGGAISKAPPAVEEVIRSRARRIKVEMYVTLMAKEELYTRNADVEIIRPESSKAGSLYALNLRRQVSQRCFFRKPVVGVVAIPPRESQDRLTGTLAFSLEVVREISELLKHLGLIHRRRNDAVRCH
jgi:hypothetical protein